MEGEVIWKMNYQVGLWRVRVHVWLCTSIGTSPGLTLPPLGPRGIQILLGEHTGMLSRTVCVLYCLFIHNCCFLCFSLLANIVEIFLSSCLSLPCPQVKGSPPLLFCFLSLHGKLSKPFLVVLLLQNQVSVKFWWYNNFTAWWTRGESGKEAKAWFYYGDYYYFH